MSSFRDEVYGRVVGFVEITPHRRGDQTLYSARLTPYMLNPQVEQKLPPGQLVRVGNDGYENEIDRPTEPGDWACRPRFKSFESARRMIVGWIRRERRDIINACVNETRDALIWRAKRARP